MLQNAELVIVGWDTDRDIDPATTKAVDAVQDNASTGMETPQLWWHLAPKHEDLAPAGTPAAVLQKEMGAQHKGDTSSSGLIFKCQTWRES